MSTKLKDLGNGQHELLVAVTLKDQNGAEMSLQPGVVILRGAVKLNGMDLVEAIEAAR